MKQINKPTTYQLEFSKEELAFIWRGLRRGQILLHQADAGLEPEYYKCDEIMRFINEVIS